MTYEKKKKSKHPLLQPLDAISLARGRRAGWIGRQDLGQTLCKVELWRNCWGKSLLLSCNLRHTQRPILCPVEVVPVNDVKAVVQL